MVENYRKSHPAKQPASNKQKNTISGKVVNVADGDTITILNAENKQTKVRLYGIDAPEKAQDFGNVSREHLASLVAGKNIEVFVIDVDQYGRSVGRIKVDGKEVAEEMLKSGLAWLYATYCKIPECKHWKELESQAKTAKTGLWSNPTAKEPWLWRKEHRNN
ncbi:MAG: thermonuclease family protein [Elusimicrobiaceae bacterium]|nr:thermonuclease family protein [Elusimicrobiaceae bacterium]